jgi:hypothetical protein
MHSAHCRSVRLVVLALAASSSLAGCSKKEDALMAARGPVADVTGEAADAPAPGAKNQLEVPDVAERKVIRSARMELRADDPAAVAAVATALTAQAGGFVAASNATGVGEAIERVDMTLRVPAERFEAVLGDLRDDGEVLVEALQGQDVTDEYIDLDARLRSQKALEERLLGILAQTTAVKDVLDVEAKLVEVRIEIERVEGRLRSMNDRISFATIELAVLAPTRQSAREAESTMSRFDRALDDAGDASIAVLTGMIRFLGAILPLAIIGLPVGLGAQAAIRRRRRKG